MKRRNLRNLALFMALLLLFSSMPLGVFAADTSPYLRTEDEAIAYVEEYANDISNKREKYHIVAKTPINSFTSGKSYVLYSFEPTGYAIYDEISGILEEMMLGAKNPYSGVKNEKLFYGGPMNYITEIDGRFISLVDSKELQNTDIEYLAESEQSTVNSRAAMVQSAIKNQATTRAVPSTVTNHMMSNANFFTTHLGSDFANNVNGTCLQVACCTLLAYYDHHVSDRFVPLQYECNYGIKDDLHILMQSFMTSGSINIPTAMHGLNAYLSYINFYEPIARCELTGCDTVYSRVCNNVYNNKPTVLAMSDSIPNVVAHSVVAYGYREELRGQELISASYFVHTGWHNSPLGTFSYDWFVNDLYIAY